jgi:hypothetical protein
MVGMYVPMIKKPFRKSPEVSVPPVLTTPPEPAAPPAANNPLSATLVLVVPHASSGHAVAPTIQTSPNRFIGSPWSKRSYGDDYAVATTMDGGRPRLNNSTEIASISAKQMGKVVILSNFSPIKWSS